MKSEIDIIILSNAKTEIEYQMTSLCLKSIRESELNISFNIIVIENNDNLYNEEFAVKPMFDDICKTILISEKFNYNLFLHYGYQNIEKSDATHLVIANNDLFFYSGWATELFANKDIAQSFSPWCPDYHDHFDLSENESVYFGHEITKHICGWCLILDKKILKNIPFEKLFPTEFNFWYQDNYYGEVLQHYGINHALLRHSVVKHFVSKSHHLIPDSEYQSMTKDAKIKFDTMVNLLRNNEIN